MSLSDSEVKLYVDTLIVQTLLTDEVFHKTAQAGGIVSEIIHKAKDYFARQIKPEDKVGSVVNMLAPGVISTTLSAMGLGWISWLVGLAIRFFHIDVAGIFRSAWNGLKELITGNKPTSSAHIDSVVDSAIQEHDKPASAQEAQTAFESAEKQPEQKKSTNQLLRDAQLTKLAMIQYRDLMTKEARPSLNPMEWFSTRKATTSSLLGIVLKWVFKVALASAGLMIAGDAINHFLGRPNALDGTQDQKVDEAHVAPQVTSKQTKFKVNPQYQDQTHSSKTSWVENIPNNKAAIAEMVLGWSKQIYQGLDNLDNIIRNTAGFQAVVEAIEFNNNRSRGSSVIFIPNYFGSKKMIVDHFIDEVAEKTP